MTASNWMLLRTKADQATADDDWVGTNTEPDFEIGINGGWAVCPVGLSREYAVGGVEIRVDGVDADRALVNRSTNTCTVTLVGLVDRSDPARGGEAGLDPVLEDVTAVASVPLQAIVFVPFNGGQFTVRISANTGIVGPSDLEVWWRPVAR